MYKNKRLGVRTICTVGILAALYVPLAIYVAVQIGNVRISFGSLPVVIAALLFGPLEAILTAMIGEFFKQILTYGFAYTTFLYLIPPALRGAVIGAAAIASMRHGRRLEDRRGLYYAVCVLAAVATTTGSTLVNWLDSVLLDYYTPALIFGDAAYRFAVGMLNAVIIASIATPLVQQLRRRRVV